jgi:hypothetical protein
MSEKYIFLEEDEIIQKEDEILDQYYHFEKVHVSYIGLKCLPHELIRRRAE